MTREETVKLLETLMGAYPETFIKDAKMTVNIWHMAFAEEDAGKVYKAARYHMEHKPKFPAPADIKKAMARAYIYEHPQQIAPLAIEGSTEPQKDWTTGCDICPYADSCLKDICIV